MKKTTLMKNLSTKFKLEVVGGEEFYGRPSEGIWIRDGLSKINYSLEANLQGNHPLDEFIRKCGWFVEPYDAETFLVYPV